MFYVRTVPKGTISSYGCTFEVAYSSCIFCFVNDDACVLGYETAAMSGRNTVVLKRRNHLKQRLSAYFSK
jgi:hypothetical protein